MIGRIQRPWKSSEHKPKHGIEVLVAVFVRASGERFVAMGRWNNTRMKWDISRLGEHEYYTRPIVYAWQPMPKAPYFIEYRDPVDEDAVMG